MENDSLFRSSWCISKSPLNEDENPLMETFSPEYSELSLPAFGGGEKMKSQKHIRKAIFVFKDGKFICKYEGIMEALTRVLWIFLMKP